MAQGVDYYDRPYTVVNREINDMASRADEAIRVANEVISGLSNLQVYVNAAPPRHVLGTVSVPQPSAIAAPDVTRFGDIGPLNLPDYAELGLDFSGIDLEIGEFDAPYALQRPRRPGPIDTSGAPVRPTLADVTIPPFDVDTTVPALQALDDIVVPEFVFETLPVFSAAAPTFNIAQPVTQLQWTEQAYRPEVLDDVAARIRTMLAGGTGLPAAIEAALFDRSRGREDTLAIKAEQDAYDAYAGRGFTMPPGMLVKQVAGIQEDNRLKAAANNREILIKATEVEIANLQFAVTQGIALEQLLINIWNNMAQRAFEAARFRVDADIRLHDSLVQAFNAQQTAYQVEASVYETRLKGELAKLEAYKARLEGLKVRGELNQQRVAIFAALVDAMRGRIEAYTARMSGAKVQAEVIGSVVDAYRADVQAWAETMAARKIEYDAYDSEVKAELALAQGNESAARAFASTVDAQQAKANVKIEVLRSKIQATSTAVQKFLGLVQAESARVGAARDVVQANATAYGAEMQRFTAEIGRDTAGRQLAMTASEANLRSTLSYYEIEVREYDAQLSRIIQSAQVQQSALDAAGRAAAQLAAGAMAAINVGASISGAASVSDAFGRNLNKSQTWNYDGEDSAVPGF